MVLIRHTNLTITYTVTVAAFFHDKLALCPTLSYTVCGSKLCKTDKRTVAGNNREHSAADVHDVHCLLVLYLCL